MNPSEPRRVIIGVQDSIAGMQAIRRGVAEARYRQATVYAVRATDDTIYGRYARPEEWRVDQATGDAAFALDVVVRALGGIPPDVEVRVVAVDGAPGPALVEFADRDEDLLVVGDAQRAGIRRLGSGAVARHCIRRAGCPVLVVPPPTLSRLGGRELVRAVQRLVNA